MELGFCQHGKNYYNIMGLLLKSSISQKNDTLNFIFQDANIEFLQLLEFILKYSNVCKLDRFWSVLSLRIQERSISSVNDLYNILDNYNFQNYCSLSFFEFDLLLNQTYLQYTYSYCNFDKKITQTRVIFSNHF